MSRAGRGKKGPTAISIVHRNKVVLNSLLALIGGTEGFACVGVHSRVEDALRKAAVENPRVVLVDLEPEDPKALQRLWNLHERLPRARILVLVDSLDWRLVTSLLELGAGGVLLKPVAPARLLEAVAQMDEFGVAVSIEVMQVLVDGFHKRSASHRYLEKLSEREREILEHLSKGYLSKQIADRCAISVETVNSHLTHIYAKLRVHSRAGAVGYLAR